MTAETTNPIPGSIISVLGFGTPAYDDISKLSNIGILPQTTPTTTNVTTTTYVDVAGISLAYTKLSSTSRLFVLMFAGAYADSTGGVTVPWRTTMGVSIDATDYDVGGYNWNALNDHRQIIGGAVLVGISQGAKTVQVRAKNDVASKRTTFDANDRITMILMELP